MGIVAPLNGSDFSLEEMQKIVGGHIEIVQTKYDDHIMVINEEGKLEAEPVVNRMATKLYKFNEHDVIVGDVLVCRSSMVR